MTLQVTMIWIVILIEHIILATKFVYSVAIEDAPDWVQRSRDGIAAMKYIPLYSYILVSYSFPLGPAPILPPPC